MAATVQLTIQTNEPQVRAQLNSIQQQLNQMTSRQYNIQINAQLNQQLITQLNSINTLLGDIRNNQRLSIYVNASNIQQTNTQLRAMDTSIRNVQTAANGTTQAVVTLDNNLQQFNQEMQNSRGRTDGLTNAFRMLRNVLVTEVRQAFSSALTEMKAVDTELITIQKVTNESAEGMKRYADDAYEVASRLGAGASEYLNAVAEFAKAGYGQSAKELGELAITTAKVGDTTQSMANQFLLSVDAAYRYEGSIERLTAVLDGANEIGNRFPTSVDKIAQGLGKVSPIAAQAHVGIDELTAAIGTITAVTQRSGTEAATALRALFLNIMGDTKTEIEDGAKWTAGEIEGLRDLLKEYAPEVVKAADATKTLINPMEAIAALAKAMDKGFLSEQKLMEMVSDIGGKLRSSQLLALIQNFDKYNAMLKTYRESAGSAAQEYSIYLDSWEAKTKQLSATWTDFVQRQLGTDKIKKLLDILIDIVENLDNWTPLIKSIAAAIVAMNLPGLLRIIQTLGQSLLTVHGALGFVIVALGVVDSLIKQHVANLKKAAQESLDNSKKEQEEVKAMQELAAQYAAAKEGSDEFKTASEKMRTALGLEGEAVADLSEEYRQLMIAKAQANAVDANTALSKAGTALSGQYGAWSLMNMDAQYVDLYDKGDSFLSGVQNRLISSSAVKEQYFRGAVPRYGASDTTASGVAAYYEAVAAAMYDIETEAYRLKKAGNEAAATKLLDSKFYKDLGDVVSYLGESYATYSEARNNATEADRNASGIAEFYSSMELIRGQKLTEKQFAVYLKQIENSQKLSESQKEILKSMAIEFYPDFAKSIGLVSDSYKEVAEEAEKAEEAIKTATSALAQFQEATKKGNEKDDPFKSYKEAYDTVMKEAKKGRYGSNAFQYGIRAILDADYIKSFNGDWNALVKDMEKSIGGLYSNSESMGKGLLDMVMKNADVIDKNLFKMIDKESGKLLASFDKKTGAFQITEDPEGIKILASKMGMSAESLIAGAMALGAIDPNADLTNLNKALQDIISGSGEEEDPTVTALNASTEAQNNSAEAQNNSAEAQDKSAEAQDKAAQAEETAAKALLHAANAYGADKHEAASEANGGVPGESTVTVEPDGAVVYSMPDEDINSLFAKMNGIPEQVSGTGYSLSEDRIDGGGRKSSHDGIVTPATSPEDQKAAFDRMNGNVVYGMSESDINALYAAMNGLDPNDAIKVTGAVAEGVEQGIKESSESSREFHGTGQFLSADQIPDSVLAALGGGSSEITVTGAVAEGVEQGLQNAASSSPSTFNGTGSFLSADQIPASVLAALSGDQNGAEISVDTTEATEAIEQTQEALDEIDNTEAEATATVDPSGAVEGAATATAAIESIPKEVESHVVVNVDINMTRHGLGAGGNSGGDWAPTTRASGDEYFRGGPVLVNDEPGGWNPELIVANGRAFIANGGDPVVLNLPSGARIYNATETRDIIGGGSDLFNVPSFEDGMTKFVIPNYRGSGKGKKTSSSSGGGGSSSSGSGAKDFDDDMMKKLEQYMAEILDAAEDALNDQLEAINAQIYALKYQTEAAEKATALEEARLQLLEAEKNLLDANTERTVRYYNAATGQWEWMADQREVMRAQEELYDAQKNLLEAEYDALATAWKELKDEISKALENGEEIDINEIIAALGRSAASGSVPALQELIGNIFGYTEDPRAVANFDGGGLASGLGWMPKGTRGTEAVLDSSLTKAILNPQTNAAFTGFTDSLATLFQLAGGNGGLPSSRFMGNVSNLYGGNTYIEGVKIGSDMLNRPLSEVLSTLNLYKNN